MSFSLHRHKIEFDSHRIGDFCNRIKDIESQGKFCEKTSEVFEVIATEIAEICEAEIDLIWCYTINVYLPEQENIDKCLEILERYRIGVIRHLGCSHLSLEHLIPEKAIASWTWKPDPDAPF